MRAKSLEKAAVRASGIRIASTAREFIGDIKLNVSRKRCIRKRRSELDIQLRRKCVIALAMRRRDGGAQCALASGFFEVAAAGNTRRNRTACMTAANCINRLTQFASTPPLFEDEQHIEIIALENSASKQGHADAKSKRESAKMCERCNARPTTHRANDVHGHRKRNHPLHAHHRGRELRNRVAANVRAWMQRKDRSHQRRHRAACSDSRHSRGTWVHPISDVHLRKSRRAAACKIEREKSQLPEARFKHDSKGKKEEAIHNQVEPSTVQKLARDRLPPLEVPIGNAVTNREFVAFEPIAATSQQEDCDAREEQERHHDCAMPIVPIGTCWDQEHQPMVSTRNPMWSSRVHSNRLLDSLASSFLATSCGVTSYVPPLAFARPAERAGPASGGCESDDSDVTRF